jgi:ADP-ribose pyrophosphatase YjhB (NUDIX family)
METSAGLALLARGKLLLCHPTRARWWATYSIPKGLVEPDESILDTAIRETREEVGITVFPEALQPGGDIRYVRNGRVTKVVHYFVVDVTALDPPETLPKPWLQLAEIDWAGFLGKKEAALRILPRFEPLLALIRAE